MIYTILDAPQLKAAYDAATASMEEIALAHRETASLEAAKDFIEKSPAFDLLRSKTPVHGHNIEAALEKYQQTRPDCTDGMTMAEMKASRLVGAWAAAFEREIRKFDNPALELPVHLQKYAAALTGPGSRL